jgi:hypothetical protein
MEYKKIKKLVKWAEKISMWVDFLRFKITEKINLFSERLLQLDTDNSNFCNMFFNDVTLSWFKVTTRTWTGLVMSCAFRWVVVPVIYYEEYNWNTASLTKCIGKIDLYGSYFRLIDIEQIFNWNIFSPGNSWDFSYIIYDLNKDNLITRLDYRIDFFYNDENKKLFTPQKVTKLRNNWKIENHYTWDTLDSWRLWDRKNKNYFIRWYNKLLDSEKKWKFWLYADYFDFKKVYRLEYEFLNHFCKPTTLKDYENLKTKIQNFFHLWKLDYSYYKTKHKTILKTVFEKMKYSRNTKAYMKWCIENNINIFSLLEDVLEWLWIPDVEIQRVYAEYIQKRKTFEFAYEDFLNN